LAISCKVNLVLVTLGFVDKIANMIVKTLDNNNIKLGRIKCEFLEHPVSEPKQKDKPK
jgi:hypothetical protein